MKTRDILLKIKFVYIIYKVQSKLLFCFVCSIYRITTILKVVTDIFTSITRSTIGRAVIREIKYVKTFKTMS